MATKKATKTDYVKDGNKVGNLSVGLVTGTDRTCYAQWTHTKASDTESYKYDWEYQTKHNGKWYPGSNGTVSVSDAKISGTKYYRHTYNAPNEAIQARCSITPVPEKTKVNKKNVNKYTPKTAGPASHDFRTDKLPTPTISISMSGNTASVEVTCNDEDCNYMNVTASEKSGSKYTVVQKWYDKKCDGRGTITKSIPAGKTLYFRAYCASTKKEKGKSSWSSYSSAKGYPAKPTGISAKATGSDSASVAWSAAAGATTYKAQYVADSKDFFNANPGEVHTQDDITGTSYTPTGLESGHTYYFRVCGVNDTGDGAWSSIVSTVLATKPDPPTTYETEPSYTVDEVAYFRWTHNSEDKSVQTRFQLRWAFYRPGTSTPVVEIEDESSDDSWMGRHLGTVDYRATPDGTELRWMVRTKGAHSDWSDWSVERSLMIYTQPELTVSLTDAEGNSVDDENPLTAFPLDVSMDASGGGGTVVAYHVTIVAAEAISWYDEYGTENFIAPGDVAFSADYLTSDDPYTARISSGESRLYDGGMYIAVADVAMASGLRATAPEYTFAVDFDATVPEPTALVEFDDDSLTASIIPECFALDEYDEETDQYQEGVTLSVLRIDQDGTLTMLRSGITNDGTETVVDPHATFGECWYHIVATDTATGITNFADVMGESVHDTCVIQWDDNFNEAISPDDDGERDWTYSGMRIDGLYNLMFSENGEVEAEDVSYIGRAHPVSYYGTQKGYKASYQIDFPKNDSRTLQLARRLQGHLDDIYVREPSGTGFWAHATTVSIDRNYDTAAITLRVDAVRVDRTDSALEAE